MKCPKCNSDLVSTKKFGIEVEYCSYCKGVWLDFEELNQIQEILTLLPIELEGPIGQRPNLSKEDTSLLIQLYESTDQHNPDRPIKKLRIKNELLGGFGGARILVIVPVEQDGTPGGKNQAPRVVKIGPQSMLEPERNNYNIFVKEHLITAVAQQTRFAIKESRAAIEYIFVGGGMLEPVCDLNTYYRKHSAGEIVEVINALVEHLGTSWYSRSSALGEHTYVEYESHLPPYIELKLRVQSDDCTWTQGDVEPQSITIYDSINLNDILAPKQPLENKEVKLYGLRVARVKPGSATLEHTEEKHIKIRLDYEKDSGIADKLKINQHINIRGQMVFTRNALLETIIKTAFNCSVEEALARLGKGIYPNPLSFYPNVLDTWLEGHRTTIHGDLHPRNILVDSHKVPWLIDFGRVREGHTLFDFIKLETYIRLDILSETSNLSSSDYVSFEERLAKAVWYEDNINIFPSKSVLQKAFHVICAIRHMARRFHPSVGITFPVTYSRCLLLYNLAVLKYARGAILGEVNEHEHARQLRFAQHCFITTAVQGRWLENPPTRKSSKGH